MIYVVVYNCLQQLAYLFFLLKENATKTRNIQIENKIK